MATMDIHSAVKEQEKRMDQHLQQAMLWDAASILQRELHSTPKMAWN
jgi:hypothetical protein